MLVDMLAKLNIGAVIFSFYFWIPVFAISWLLAPTITRWIEP